jgi:hypothetical protein
MTPADDETPTTVTEAAPPEPTPKLKKTKPKVALVSFGREALHFDLGGATSYRDSENHPGKLLWDIEADVYEVIKGHYLFTMGRIVERRDPAKAPE